MIEAFLGRFLGKHDVPCEPVKEGDRVVLRFKVSGFAGQIRIPLDDARAIGKCADAKETTNAQQ